MSSRLREKQRRRAERDAQGRQAAARERRARRLRVVGATGLGLLAMAGVAGLTALAGGGDGKLPTDSASAFGQHYEGLQQRRRAAGMLGSLKLADGKDIQATFGPRRNLPPADETMP